MIKFTLTLLMIMVYVVIDAKCFIDCMNKKDVTKEKCDEKCTIKGLEVETCKFNEVL